MTQNNYLPDQDSNGNFLIDEYQQDLDTLLTSINAVLEHFDEFDGSEIKSLMEEKIPELRDNYNNFINNY